MKLNKITLLTTLAILASSEAYSHGYVESPASRNFFCKEGKNKNCGTRAQYEPQSIEQADGQFDSRGLDKNMGSANVGGFEPLDEQEQSRWAKTVVKPGQPLKLKWQFTANHKSKHFKFYITKPNWDPNKLLTRADFEDNPLNCYNPEPSWIAPNQPPKDGLTFTCTMPNRNGYQVIMAEWDVYDTGASFYNLIDLDFTNSKPAGTVILADGSSGGGESDSGIQTYDPNKEYPEKGTEVVYEGKVYRSKWYVNPRQKPGSQSGPWEYVRDYTDKSDPSDPFPVEATKFAINPADIKDGDKISLQVFKDETMKEYLLLTVPKGMSSNDLFADLTSKINQLSSQEFNNQIIAGVKNNNNDVITGSNALYIYQTAEKPYNDISFYYQQSGQNMKNELHLMDFQNEYSLNSNDTLSINGKIMSHSSAKVKVSVVLQDKAGNEVYRKSNIEIAPMDTYNLALQASDISAGDYKLIVSSTLAGAEAWQKAMDIKITASGGGSDGVTKANVSFETNTPFYYVKSQDAPVVAVAHYKDIGEVNFGDGQVVKINPWAKTSVAIGNDSSTYVTCPKPTNNQTAITYVVTGDLSNLSCKIK